MVSKTIECPVCGREGLKIAWTNRKAASGEARVSRHFEMCVTRTGPYMTDVWCSGSFAPIPQEPSDGSGSEEDDPGGQDG